MRRPLSSELSAEDRMLARRWAIAVTAFYSTILILTVGGVLTAGTPSRTDNVSVVANSERK
jgi:hypothetical protein